MIRLRADIPVAIVEWCVCGKHARMMFTWQVVAAWRAGRARLGQ